MADGNKLPNGRFLKIDELFAFVSVDKEGEGVVGMRTPDGWMPLVGADMERLESLRPIAQEIANRSGKQISVRRYSTMVEIEVIRPKGEDGVTPHP